MIELIRTNTEIIVTITKKKPVEQRVGAHNRWETETHVTAFPIGTKFSLDTDRSIPLKFKYPEGTNEKK